MIKKVILTSAIFIICSVMWGQGIYADLQSYAQEMEKYQDLVSNPTIEDLLERITQEDSEALYEMIDYLQGDYLSSLEQYLQAIMKIKPTTIKVKFLHTQFIESYDALYIALSAISRIDKNALKAAESSIDAELPDEYNEFIFGINLFSIKMNTYSALNRELSFLAQFEIPEGE
ncbi:hypothetical protein JEZ13_01515 [bacterium]|nr:hypothetical protein [bacterium]